MLDDVVLVSEDQIAHAMSLALEQHHLVVEGGGAVGIAAVQDGLLTGPAGNVAVVVSGGNVDVSLLLRLAAGGWECGKSA